MASASPRVSASDRRLIVGVAMMTTGAISTHAAAQDRAIGRGSDLRPPAVHWRCRSRSAWSAPSAGQRRRSGDVGGGSEAWAHRVVWLLAKRSVEAAAPRSDPARGGVLHPHHRPAVARLQRREGGRDRRRPRRHRSGCTFRSASSAWNRGISNDQPRHRPAPAQAGAEGQPERAQPPHRRAARRADPRHIEHRGRPPTAAMYMP